MKLLAATGNKHKLEEFRRILSPLGINVISLNDIGLDANVEETGKTFLENAEIKAMALYKLTGIPTFADDSGLCIDALGGRPGVYSARYGGESLPHGEKIGLILKEMESIPDERRGARFTAAIFCVLGDDSAIACEGNCEGRIGYEPRGGGGFGYDPIFMVGERSFAELSGKEKDEISHRGRALREFCEKLGGSRQGLILNTNKNL